MSTDDPRRYLIAYDVADDVRRGRLAKKLESYGDRVQYSVFVLEIRPAGMIRLRSAMVAIIESNADSVLVCDLGPAGQVTGKKLTFLGRQRPITATDSIIV